MTILLSVLIWLAQTVVKLILEAFKPDAVQWVRKVYVKIKKRFGRLEAS